MRTYPSASRCTPVQPWITSLTIVYRAAKEQALEAKLATPAEDETAGGGAFDALDEDDEFGGGGLMVSRLRPKSSY